MTKIMKFWTGLGVAALSGAVAAGAASVDQEAKGVHSKASGYLLVADAGEGGEAGSGGEGGEAGSGEETSSRVDYLTDLGLLEGHMRVGVALAAAGNREAALAHMKHPGDELYDDLKGHFEELGVPGLADELAAIARSVEASAAPAETESAMQALAVAIAACRKTPMTSAETGEAIAGLMRFAADEYGDGVKDGKVVEAHEYQDAWGFMQTAKAYLAGVPEDERKEHAEAFGEIAAELAKLDAAWPDLSGAAPIAVDPSLLLLAASRIELAASEIR